MPSVCKADLPPLPESEDVWSKASAGDPLTPLDQFVMAHQPVAKHQCRLFREALTAALHWYVEDHQRLYLENMGNKRREELRAGFDHVPAEDEGSTL